MISIRNPLAEKLAREVAQSTGTTMTDAIIEALEEKKERLTVSNAVEKLRFSRIMETAEICMNLPDLDTRSPDEILGYNDEGVF